MRDAVVETERFVFSSTPLAGVWVIAARPIVDERGRFMRHYCEKEFAQAGVLNQPLVQINVSETVLKGTVRGLHFQDVEWAESKVVTCLDGAVWDVAVDLRHESPTFLEHHSLLLKKGSDVSFLIPAGVAHGFQTLTDDCRLLYLHSSLYRADAEGGVDPLDRRLAIPWPLPVSVISDRDKGLPPVRDDFVGLRL